MILGTFAGAGYLGYNAYYPQKKVRQTPSAPVEVKATSTSTGYEEEWIPDVHIKSRKSKGLGGALSSGDESGAEKKTKSKKK